MNKNLAKNLRFFIAGITAFTFMIVVMSGCSSNKFFASSRKVVYDNNSVTTRAEFPGGKAAYDKYLFEKYHTPGYLIDTPTEEEGVGIYTFIVNEKGRIKNVEIVQNVGPNVDVAMYRVLKNMPTWKPATLNGKPVCTKVEIRQNFIVGSNKPSYDIAPQYPGGIEALQSHLTAFSDNAGKILVEFIIDEEGNVRHPRIKSGGYYPLQQQALSLVGGLSKWKPAMKNGKPVRMKRTVYVKFEKY